MKKIMIIDDDPVIVKYLEKLFHNNGYLTCVATDGSQGVEIVKKENPDLITLDLEMPKEWGPRFYRKLSKEKQYKHIPVIVISGLTGNQYAVHKAVASLTKPFDKDKLIDIVNETIGQ